MWFFCLVLFAVAFAAKQLVTRDFAIAIATLTESGVIRDVVIDDRDFDTIRNAGLLDVGECPLKTTYFECDDQGRIVQLRIAPTLPGVFNSRRLGQRDALTGLKNVTVENFEGLFESPRVRVATIVVRNSTLHDVVLPFASLVVLENVVFTKLDWTLSVPYLQKCDFVNVSLPCPIPAIVQQTCFNRSTSAPPCWLYPVKLPPMASQYTNPCISATEPCRATCSPPFNASFDCQSKIFPLTVGPTNVVSLAYTFLSEAVELIVKTSGVIGQVTRVELFDWSARAWTVVVDRPMSTRSLASQETFKLPRILTNRINVTLEQWWMSDDVIDVTLTRSAWPERAMLVTKQPTCAAPMTLSERSMLDDTLADSLCVRRVCQLACADATDNFTFARAVRPLYLVVEGGAEWTGATLVARPSAETRVYALPAELADVAVVRAPGLEPSGVRRVRLVGESAAIQDTLVPTIPSRKGMPGVLIKRLETQRAPGATLVLNGTEIFNGKANATFRVDANVSVAFVLTNTFAFAQGKLWRGEPIGTMGARWTLVETSGEVTRLVLNRDEEPARRVLVGLDDGLLAVVSASVRLHDGSTDRLLTNRVVQQMSIDVLNVRTSAWYTGIVQHDIARNLSDIDVVQWNRTRFGVVDRASGRVSVIEYRAFPYTLVPCDSNRDCASCIGNVANDEMCAWCPADDLCKPTISACRRHTVLVCPSTAATTPTTATMSMVASSNASTTTTTTIATSTTTNDTISTTISMSPSPSADLNPSTESDDDQATTVGLAVGISVVVVALLLAAGVGAWFCLFRRVDQPAEKPVELQQPPTAVDSPRSALSREYSDVSEVRGMTTSSYDAAATTYNDVEDIRE